MSKLVICEKPSVAQKVAAVLLEKEKELEAVEERRKQEQRTDQQR